MAKFIYMVVQKKNYMTHTRHTRELKSPDGRLILVSADEILRGQVDGKDAIDLSLL